MKNLLIMIALLITSTLFSQEKEVEYSVYVPLRTYHYDRTPDYDYHSTEGGNIGAVVTRRNHGNVLFTDINLGVIRNSYNNISVVGQYGVGKRLGKVGLSLNMGLISGYKNLFEDGVRVISGTLTHKGATEKYSYEVATPNNNQYKDIVPSWMKDNGILPAVNLSLSYNTGRVSPLLVISPEYINAGISIKI